MWPLPFGVYDMSPDPTPAPQPPDYEPGRSPTSELDPANTPEPGGLCGERPTERVALGVRANGGHSYEIAVAASPHWGVRTPASSVPAWSGNASSPDAVRFLLLWPTPTVLGV